MTDPRLDAAAARRDLPAVVDAVADRIAMPSEPSGPLAACARALVDRHLADADTAPAVARVVAEALLQVAKTCLACGEIHTARYSARPGETAHLTWAHPVDGHVYRPTTQMVIYWLDRVLQEGA
jgi:hypothetical protein